MILCYVGVILINPPCLSFLLLFSPYQTNRQWVWLTVLEVVPFIVFPITRAPLFGTTLQRYVGASRLGEKDLGENSQA